MPVPAAFDYMLYGVFALFGIQTLAAGGGWLFNTWRTFQDMKDAYEADEYEEQATT